MEFDDPNCVQRRVHPRSIDVHPTEKAIVVTYELEAALIGDLGDTMIEESKECQKIIRLKSLNESSDIEALTTEIIHKCDLIPQSKYDELKTLLQYLRSRKDPSSMRPQTASMNERQKSGPLEIPESAFKIVEDVSINQLNEYIELLYEELNDKIRSSYLILQLSRNTDNLMELITNETLIRALSRVLREDGKKSLDLSTNIVYIFSYISNFSQFHSSISRFKVGAICFDLLETELTREENWFKELNEKHALVEREYNLTNQSDYEKSLKKYQLLIKKQNPLIRLVFILLLNLSEDPKVEIKIVNKGIVRLLVKTLERDSHDLLIVVVTFLKKLSIYMENKNQMKEMVIMNKLAPLLSLNNENLLIITLRLMHNLVFDLQLRMELIKLGLFPKMVMLFGKDPYNHIVSNILYQISRDDKCKALFNHTADTINLIITKILKCSSNHVPIELMAFSINLSLNQKNAQIMCDNGNLEKLMNRAINKNDPLIFKMIRNISHHDDAIKMQFLDYHEQLIEIIIKNESEDVVIECLAIIGNLTLQQINWELLFKKYDLMKWINERLKPENMTEDDITLQIVILIGTAANQKECASYFIECAVSKVLINLLNAKQEDDEMVLQIVYAFHVMIKHSDVRESIIKDLEVPAYLIDLMHDRNSEIKRVCNSTLDLIAEHDTLWWNKIKVEKFCAHNKQWIEMIQSQRVDDDQTADSFAAFDEVFAYPNLIMKTDILNDSSSDTQSEHSLHLSIQGMTLNQHNSSQTSPILGHQSSGPTLSLSSRPQTGYKKRTK